MEYTKLLGKVTLTCDGKHDSSKQYDRLCLVYDNDYKSFISIKEVPVNISITNKAYWQPVSAISADGEDIMVDYDFNLKFADKEYVPNQFSGLGRKLLRKRIVNNINLLQQSDINRAGTIYRIQYDYNLQGQTIQIPENCVLFFDGGSISNGTIVLNNTLVLPQCLDIAKNIKCNISGNYQNGQIYYDSTQDKLIAVIGQKLVDLSEKGSGSGGPVSNYTWIRYANNASGLNMTMQPQADTTHIGIAENQAVETPSSNPVDYTWILFKGPQGEKGIQGERGIQGPPGEKGEPGKDGTDGKPGESVKPNWNTWVFKQSELQPSKPNFFIPTPGAAGIDGWFDGPGSTGRWWMSMGLVDGSTDTVTTWTDPVQCTGEDGKTNSYMDFKYAKSAAETIPPPLDRTVRFPEGWTDEPPTLIKGEFMWMINALIDENGDLVDKWVGPIRITGESGPQGEPGEGLPGVSYKTVFAYKSSEEEPEKPVGGSWDSETNEVVYPEGWQGNDQKLTPPIWMSDRTFTSNPDIVEDWSTPIKISGADGKPGADGKADEFIYKRTATAGDLDRPDTPTSEQIDDYVPTDLGWTDTPRGVTTTYQGEWVSTRSKKDGKWGPFSQPALWSKWGANGQDGDGVQYIFYRTTTNNDPDNPTPNNTNSDAYQETGDFEGIEYIPGGWSDDPIGVTKEYPYEWVCQRKFRGGRWRAYTGPSLWAKYGKDGLDGLGSIVLDLDNEIQSVATDSLGNVVGGLPLNATLSMYYGTVQLNLSSLTVRPPEGVVATADRQSGIITVTSIANTTDTTIRIPIDASTVYNNELMERTTYLTINKIKPGADGQTPKIYQLAPSVSAIHVNKNGTPSVSTVSCGIRLFEGDSTTSVEGTPYGYYFAYKIDNASEMRYYANDTINTSGIVAYITFSLYDQRNSNSILVDQETLYVLKDGEDGESGSVPNWSTYVYKKSNSRPAKPTFKNPRPGTTGIDGWLDYPTTSDGQWWQCVGMVDGPKDEVQTWSEVIQLNGKNGEALDGKHTEFRFMSMTKGHAPSIATTVRNPAGWTTTVPVVNSYEYLWMSHAEIAANDELIGVWDQPVRISGEDGAAGKPGVSLYTWIKYSDDQPTSDSQIYDKPNMYTKYIGLAYNQTSSVESTRYTDYEWVKWVGNDGVNGTNGLRGRLVYPAGTYIHNKTYEATDTQAPFVLQGEAFYVMNKTTTWNGQNLGVTPEQDWNSNGINATWILMDDFEAVYTKLLIADNGTLGDFVFNKEYMFSKQGTDALGQESTDYQNFNSTVKPFSFTDTSIWAYNFKSSSSNYNGTITSDTITITGKTSSFSATDYLIWTQSSHKDLPEFNINVKGVSNNSNIYLLYNYMTEGGVRESIRMDYDGVYALPKSFIQSGTLKYGLQLVVNLTSTYLSEKVVVTLLPNNFNPNFQVNGITGEVTMNKATVKGRFSTNAVIHRVTSFTTTHSLTIPNDYSFKTLYIVKQRNDVTVTNNTIDLYTSSFATPDPEFYPDEYQADQMVQAQLNIVNLTSYNVDIHKGPSRLDPGFMLPNSSGFGSCDVIRLYNGGNVTIDFIYFKNELYAMGSQTNEVRVVKNSGDFVKTTIGNYAYAVNKSF